MDYILIGCRSLVVLVFVVSLVSKLRNRQTYGDFVAATGRLSPWSAATAATRRLAIGVVAIEISAVVLILVPATTSIGFAVATVLLLAFTGAIVLALRRGERAPCRCFGSAAQPLGHAQVVRNGVLLTVAVLGLIGGQLPVATPGPAGVLVSVVAGALAATLAVTADDIVALFRPV